MTREPITSVLRKRLNRAIDSGETTFLGLEKATGIKRQSLMLFAREKQSLLLSAADALAAHFKLRMVGPTRKDTSRKGG